MLLPSNPDPLAPPARRWVVPAGIAAVLAVLAVLLLTGLGHHAYWDDEAGTALGAKGILRTGDTSVRLDHGNIVAYREGETLRHFREVVSPVLASYVTAGSFAVFGVNAWSGRLPFALLGLGTAALMLVWARRESPRALAVLALALVGNVSLILYARNCRYYSLTIFFSVAMGFLYWRRKPDTRSLLVFAGLSVLLFAANYLNYLALYVCLAVDYLCWQRHKFPLGWRALVLLGAPQLAFGGIILSLWNPFLTHHAGQVWQNGLWDRWTLFWWYWRDANQCEFFAGPIFLLALGVGIAQRRTWLIRGCVAVTVYIAAVTLVSPQVMRGATYADVRYIVPVIPLAIALEVGAICALFESRALAVGVAALVFGTNLPNGGPLLKVGVRSTLVSYVEELAHPFPDPYALTADWVNAHVPEGSSVWVQPGYAMYPLMFHAPRALYAWQLAWPPQPQFAGLPPIHFLGQSPPDYLVAFGLGLGETPNYSVQVNHTDVNYQRVETINIYWKDFSRPELFWHTFGPVGGFSPTREAIYIFQRNAAPVAE